MKQWFDEKETQLSCYSMTAFGIEISSRYANAGEMLEMIQFAQQAARQGLEAFVLEVEYDSKSNFCTFVTSPSLQPHSSQDEQLLAIATRFISQFEWHDVVHYGSDLLEQEQQQEPPQGR